MSRKIRIVSSGGWRCLFLVLALSGLGSRLPLALADRFPVSVRIVAKTGDAAPETGSVFSGFETPRIDENGLTSFQATAGNVSGIWKESEGMLVPVVLTGDPAPETSLVFQSIEDGIMNDSGLVGFVATLEGGAVGARSGIWVEQESGGLRKAVLQGDPAPVLDMEPGPRFISRPFEQDSTGDYPFVMNNHGDIAFRTDLSTEFSSNGGNGSFKEADGVLMASHLTPYPGEPPDLFQVWSNPVFSDSGNLSNLLSYSSQVGGGRQVVGGPRTGDTAPDTNESIFNYLAADIGINSEGEVVFYSNLNNPAGTNTGINANNNAGVFTTVDGLNLVAREDDPAPETGFRFNDFGERSFVNDKGVVLFKAFLRDAPLGQRRAFYTRDVKSRGPIRLVYREGMAAPGVGEKASFIYSTSLPFEAVYSINILGTIVFISNMQPSEGSNPFLGLFAQIGGELALLLREGDLIEVGTDDRRTLMTTTKGFALGFVGGTGNGDGRPSGLNNQDEIALLLNFSDNTQAVAVVKVDADTLAARMIANVVMKISPEGYPTLDYDVVPGFRYSIERSLEKLSQSSDWENVFEGEDFGLPQRLSKSDGSIELFKKGSLGVPEKIFYRLRIQKID